MEFGCEEAVRLVLEYVWLPEFKIVDFITAEVWNTSVMIPAEWRRFAESLPLDNYADQLLLLADSSKKMIKVQILFSLLGCAIIPHSFFNTNSLLPPGRSAKRKSETISN